MTLSYWNQRFSWPWFPYLVEFATEASERSVDSQQAESLAPVPRRVSVPSGAIDSPNGYRLTQQEVPPYFLTE